MPVPVRADIKMTGLQAKFPYSRTNGGLRRVRCDHGEDDQACYDGGRDEDLGDVHDGVHGDNRRHRLPHIRS